jgi:hypothetical protein
VSLAAARAAALALVLAVALAAAAVARADGDPASDWLIQQSTYLSPSDGNVAPADASQLIQLLSEAQRKGLPLKVAVIATPADLGSVPTLFKEPQTYAKFLAEEDYYYWQNELIVVMPNGYGVYKSSGLPAADVAAIKKLHFTPTASGTTMVLAAERAVRALALRRGISLSLTAAAAASRSSSSSGSSSTDQERIEILAAAAAALLAAGAVRLARRRRRAS